MNVSQVLKDMGKALSNSRRCIAQGLVRFNGEVIPTQEDTDFSKLEVELKNPSDALTFEGTILSNGKVYKVVCAVALSDIYVKFISKKPSTRDWKSVVMELLSGF